MKKFGLKMKAFVCLLMVSALFCVPVSAGDDSVQSIVTEISADADSLFELSEDILLETKAIVKDETMDQEIYDLAKTIHLVSHETEDIGAKMQEQSAELQTLIADPVTNKAEIEEIIVDIEAECTELNEKMESQMENMHDLCFNVPECRTENADAAHDAAHQSEKVTDHMLELTEDLAKALNAPAATADVKSQAAPGFGVILTIGALLTAFIALRRN